MSSTINQRRVVTTKTTDGEGRSKAGNTGSILSELLEGYKRNTPQLTRSFDKYIITPGLLIASVLLVLTYLTNSKSTLFNKLLSSFGFFLGNFVFNVIFRDKVNDKLTDGERKKLLGEYFFYHAILLFVSFKLFTTAPPK